MKLIALRGKHAVGEHSHAMVDDEDFDRLNRWKWKAKPNGSGNHVYAVRNQKMPDGRCVDVRMHREVLGYCGPLDVDHVNRNALDNTKANLRIVTRRVNVNNTIWVDHHLTCHHCQAKFIHHARLSARRAKFCTERCAELAEKEKKRAEAESRSPMIKTCEWCDRAYEAVMPAQRFCCEPCRKAEKWKRQREAGCLPPSAHGGLGSPGQKRKEGNRGPDLGLLHEPPRGVVP